MTDELGFGRTGRTYGQWWEWLGPRAVVSLPELRNFCLQAWEAVGFPADEAAELLAPTLDKAIQGDHARGLVYFPGRIRAARALQEASSRREVRVVRDKGAVAVVEGTGQVCRAAMALAIVKARQHGVGLVGARAPGGILTPYVKMAADAGMVGVMSAQTGPAVAPFGGCRPLLGNAPLAVAIPAGVHDPVVLDMSFTQTSASGVLLAATQDGVRIPEGFLLDEHGEPTTDPRDFSDEHHTRAGTMQVKGSLTPLGNSHKGYAMIFVLSLLTGLLSDTSPPWELVGEDPGRGTGGSLVIVVDPEALNPGDVGAQVDAFIDIVISSPRKPGVEEILYPGQRSQEIKREAWARGMIDIPASHLAELVRLGEELGIDVPPTFAGHEEAPA